MIEKHIQALHAGISRRDWHTTEVAANAIRDDRLTAAAPDLLDAIAALLTWSGEPDPESKSVKDAQLTVAWAKARSAIAKARG